MQQRRYMHQISIRGLLISWLLIITTYHTGAIAGSKSVKLSEMFVAPRYTITYPDHWVDYPSSYDRNSLIIYNQEQPAIHTGVAPLYMIKTNINISLEEDLEMGVIAEKIEQVIVDGRVGVRIWAETESDFPNVISTLIPISDWEVISISSFYSLENQYAESAILQVHDSLTLQ